MISGNAAAISANTTAIVQLSVPNTIDFNDFSSNADSKTYQITGAGFCGNTETRTFASTTTDNGTDLRITRTRSNAGVTCHHKVFGYLITADSRDLLYKENYNPGSGVLASTDTLTDPITRFTSSMKTGITMGDTSPIVRTSSTGGSSQKGAFVETVTPLGFEDVTVPAGSYTGCLKVNAFRTSNGFGAFNRISWLCPGAGEVKRIQVDPGTFESRIWEMTSITFAP